MKYRDIRIEAYEANCLLPKLKLVQFTFGNASACDRAEGVFAIKPSGVPYELLTPEKMIIVDFDGNTVDGGLRPSSDTLTHAVLYKEWPDIGGICHTHSLYATAWAQALRSIPLLGTTHADHCTFDIPCARPMTDALIKGNYEKATGRQIIDCMHKKGLSHRECEMILVGSHAPFTWGKDAEKAVCNSAILENMAQMAWLTRQINPGAARLKRALIEKHYERKHGKDKYYGQS